MPTVFCRGSGTITLITQDDSGQSGSDDVPMPIHTPRLIIRPRKPGDGERALAAIRETWDELHRWMWWAENLVGSPPSGWRMLNRRAMSQFIRRDGNIELLGIETATGEPVVWCGFHESTGKTTPV